MFDHGVHLTNYICFVKAILFLCRQSDSTKRYLVDLPNGESHLVIAVDFMISKGKQRKTLVLLSWLNVALYML
jgi:hypothetical protein